jgi:hypothetical protein
VSELHRLSPLALHALRVSCAQSSVPVQLDDPATIERITALLRTTATAAPARPRAADQLQIVPVWLENRRRHHNPRGEFLPETFLPETTSAPEGTPQGQANRKRANPSLDSGRTAGRAS